MIEILNSLVSSAGSLLGSVFSGIVQLSILILALQGLLLGLLVLFFGRRSFWVFASVAGFVFGLWLASGLGAGLPAWAQPLLALTLGVAGAVVGFFAPRLVAALIGSLTLALLGVALAHSLGAASWLQWLIAIALGFVGVILFWRLLDWALMVGTSLFGALLVSLSLTTLFDFASGLGILPFLLFLVAGIVYQARDQRMAAELQRLRLDASPAPADVTSLAPLPSDEQPAVLPPPAADADSTAATPDEMADSPTISESATSESQAPATVEPPAGLTGNVSGHP